jgi:signal transduction histidine kinase
MYADARLFRQALHNLVTNAIKYSPNGGAIEVELEVMKDGASLRVSDSGIGIPVAECERLFEAFQRGSNVGSIPGTGLGMAIIKHVVDLHGGAVEVDSAPNAGTSFRVWIPRDR